MFQCKVVGNYENTEIEIDFVEVLSPFKFTSSLVEFNKIMHCYVELHIYILLIFHNA